MSNEAKVQDLSEEVQALELVILGLLGQVSATNSGVDLKTFTADSATLGASHATHYGFNAKNVSDAKDYVASILVRYENHINN